MPKARNEPKGYTFAKLVFAALFIYFAYHTVSGDRGLLAFIRLNQHVDALKIEADDFHAQRIELEHRTSLLKPNSLDLDMLDEQARRLLGFAGKDEVVIAIE